MQRSGGRRDVLLLATPINEAAQRPGNMFPSASWGSRAVRPRKGEVPFNVMDIAGGVGDRKSLHGACPATKVIEEWVWQVQGVSLRGTGLFGAWVLTQGIFGCCVLQ